MSVQQVGESESIDILKPKMGTFVGSVLELGTPEKFLSFFKHYV